MTPLTCLRVLCLAAIGGCYKGSDEPNLLTATSTGTSTSLATTDGGAASVPFLDLGAPDPATTSTTAIDTETLAPTDATTSSTTDALPAAVCGDALVEGEEGCDLGPMNNDHGACTSTCMEAKCGDGLLFLGIEECDHGDLNHDSAACTKSCTKAKCGDGLLFLGVEECDDGEDNQAGVYGGCTPMTCTLGPHCGDNVVQLPEEECDQGDQNDDANTCSPSCKWNGKVVFATSKVFSGDLGGIVGADDQCNTLAMEAGLANAGAFLAWLSDDKTSPAARMTPAKGRYLLLDGTVVADSWTDLIDGTLDAPIRIDEKGAWIADDATPYAWTGTTAAGQPVDAKSCGAWHIGTKSAMGRRGALGATSAAWTSQSDAECTIPARLLCIEQ